MNLKIGILVPGSYTVPLFTQQIVRGIKLGFEAAGTNPQYFIEDIGKAVDPNLVIAKANSLILNDADLILAIVGSKVDVQLVDLCTAVKKPLILIDAGAMITRSAELPESPYVFVNSYNMWQGCVLLGEFAGNHVGKKALVTSAFFECGYSFFPAFEVGFKRTGGELLGIHLCRDFKPEDFSVQLAGMIENSNPDMLVAFYNGKDAEDFFEYAVKTGVTKNLPIVTTSLAIAPFKGSGYPLTFSTVWDAEAEASRLFVKNYMNKHRVMPDEYAAIAYESAFTAGEAAAKLEGEWFDADSFCSALTSVTIDGPRGVFKFEVTTRSNNLFSTVLKSNDSISTKSLSEAEIKAIKDDFSQRPHSGWYNPYPCA